MRIVGGKHRGRRLSAPDGMDGLDIRPTWDRAREALFNILSHGDYDGLPANCPMDYQVLDAFAGTGALGLEALSRGAAGVCFIEQNKTAARRIQEMADDVGEEVTILNRDATQPGRAPNSFALLLMDAPYRTGQSEPSLLALAEGGWLAPGALIIWERGASEPPPTVTGFQELDARDYGAARVHFLKYSPQA